MEHNNNEMENNSMSKEEINLFEFAKKLMNATVDEIDEMAESFQRHRTYRTPNIEMMLRNPYEYKKELQEVSRYMAVTEGLLKEILMYKSNPLTLDHFILPLDMSKYKSKAKLEKAELTAAKFIEKYNIKYNISWMIQELLILGELFIYKIETPRGIIFQEIPSRLCRITTCVNNVFKYAIDIGSISDDKLGLFPVEIQQIVIKYKQGLLNDDPNLLPSGYYKLEYDENAVAFALDSSGNSLPYYLGLFKDLCTLQDMKEAQRLGGLLDNFKVLIQKIPCDKEGNMLVNRDTAYMFNEALKRVVPSGVGVFTSPLDVEDVSLSSSSNSRTISYVEDARSTLYSSAGINDEVFNGNKSSNDAILLSAMADTLLAKKLIRMFEIWLNQEFAMNSSVNNWKIKILTCTEKDREVELQNLTTRLSTWGSKKMYLAMQGFTPLEGINIVKYENMLDIGTEMAPMRTAHTMSDGEGLPGAPSNEEKTDTTKKTGDSEN